MGGRASLYKTPRSSVSGAQHMSNCKKLITKHILLTPNHCHKYGLLRNYITVLNK